MQARTCPICRRVSYFVTPSTVWPATAEEREGVIAGYKAKLATIDCRNFSFGATTPPTVNIWGRCIVHEWFSHDFLRSFLL